MSEPATNGVVKSSPGEITIGLRLTPTPNGYTLAVHVEPATVYPETVIEACERAARMLTRTLDAQATLQLAGAKNQHTQSLNREIENIRRRMA